jgi:glycosyltransferase involved in cell wall biosynthesis
MRIGFVLPGLHLVLRGAEVGFESVARELAREPSCRVTLIGSGVARGDEPYRFLHAGSIGRRRFERWPRLPLLRNEFVYEELTFLPAALAAYRPRDYDVTVTCSYPFSNWLLRRPSLRGSPRPAHVFVTQNGDWPAWSQDSEFRFFSCDGLVCTNPEFYERNKDRWPSVLIPNGVDPERFAPGLRDRQALGLPHGAPVALMVSALIDSKRVLEGIRCAAAIPELHLVVAGDGPLRAQVRDLGERLLGERFRHVVLPRERMPALYRAVDLFLHMSLDEPSANAYLEALGTGLPIVTHDRYVTRWTLEDEAILVDATEPKQVTEGIRSALALGSPDAVARRRALATRRFSWRSIARQYEAFFREVLDRRVQGAG